jgi:hypothetical protein
VGVFNRRRKGKEEGMEAKEDQSMLLIFVWSQHEEIP